MRYLVFALLLLISCYADERFDSNRWKQKGVDWQLEDHRELMVNHLISSDTLIGLTKNEIEELLGKPELSRNNKLGYLVREKHQMNVDPDYIKYLWIELDSNNQAIDNYLKQIK